MDFAHLPRVVLVADASEGCVDLHTGSAGVARPVLARVVICRKTHAMTSFSVIISLAVGLSVDLLTLANVKGSYCRRDHQKDANIETEMYLRNVLATMKPQHISYQPNGGRTNCLNQPQPQYKGSTQNHLYNVLVPTVRVRLGRSWTACERELDVSMPVRDYVEMLLMNAVWCNNHNWRHHQPMHSLLCPRRREWHRQAWPWQPGSGWWPIHYTSRQQTNTCRM